MAGRRPKPVEIKRLEGNPGKRPLPTDNPKPVIGAPVMPRRILKERGQRLWHELGPQLAANGLITELDGAAFLFLCSSYELAFEAKQKLMTDGTYLKNNRGELYLNPARRVWQEEQKAFRMWSDSFGLTPLARGRLHLSPEIEKSLAEILFGGTDEGG